MFSCLFRDMSGILLWSVISTLGYQEPLKFKAWGNLFSYLLSVKLKKNLKQFDLQIEDNKKTHSYTGTLLCKFLVLNSSIIYMHISLLQMLQFLHMNLQICWHNKSYLAIDAVWFYIPHFCRSFVLEPSNMDFKL